MNAKNSKQSSGRNSSRAKLEKSKKYSVLKIFHLPKHFEEEQLRKYFTQFGTVYGEVLESYYPSWFKRAPQTVPSVDKEKLRRAKSAVNPSKSASQRRMKSLRNRVAALKKLVPGFQLNMSNGSHPSPSTPLS
ncbi:hypothetical protein TSMEX_002421 [Taenia solium]|eukprot:TsM_001237500 transcript=TsM_001237500 gene=TsM_001237500